MILRKADLKKFQKIFQGRLFLARDKTTSIGKFPSSNIFVKRFGLHPTMNLCNIMNILENCQKCIIRTVA